MGTVQVEAGGSRSFCRLELGQSADEGVQRSWVSGAGRTAPAVRPSGFWAHIFFATLQILRQSLKLMRFTQLFDNVNPFTEAVVGDWDLPDEVCSLTQG